MNALKFFLLEPEVAGSLGADTDVDVTSDPPSVRRLHYELAGWLGDDLLESFPCFVVTARLAASATESRLTGSRLDDMQVSLSPDVGDVLDAHALPRFLWLKVEGKAGEADWGLAEDGRLVVSAAAMELLRGFNISNCDVEHFPALPSD